MRAEHTSSGGAQLAACLQSRGVRVFPGIERREGGAGPAEGITVIINNRPVTVPTSGSPIPGSPYSIQQRGNQHYLLQNGSAPVPVTIPPSPRYYSLKTAGGIPYRKIALLHGVNCLASTVLQNCTYWNSPDRCRFCGIELSLQSGATIANKTPQQLVEVAKTAAQLDGISHLTLTTGSQANPMFEMEYLALCCSHLKGETGLPIHVQLSPPSDLKGLERLQESGADTVGIHIENFDFSVLKRAAPSKARYSLERYIDVWRESVRLFSKNQVSSFIIAGLGETATSIIAGAAILCELGVYPFIVPLRPIPGTTLARHRPPVPDEIITIHRQVAPLLKAGGLSWKKSKAGCVRCGACSSLPDFEQE